MTLTFADTHNMIAYLIKSNESEGFYQIIDFLNGSSIKYTLTVNPNIYVPCIKQFWNFVVKKVNDVTRFQALVNKKMVIITEATIRDSLHFDDAKDVECLPNEEIFTELARMGYEKPSTKLTFYKAFFSSQWKFLIHTILQCMIAKRTSWNEFSSSMASVVICLSTSRKFNFSKYIFDSLVRNVESSTKFYMYLRFLQLIIRAQVGVNTPRSDEDRLKLIELTAFLLSSDEKVKVEKVNDVTRLQALVNKKMIIITEATIRDSLHLDDAKDVECLPNEEIFTELARMGYEKPSTKLTFYKAFFSSQWKFLINTILQCMIAKRTSWNEFSSSMASVVICLSTSRKFNFSNAIFSAVASLGSSRRTFLTIIKNFFWQ
nr:hypothetical protein [Tanacetum cinerariifolium]